MRVGMRVHVAHQHCCGARPERERGELVEHIDSGGVLLLQTLDRCQLCLAAALAIDDECVLDLTRVDSRSGKMHRAHKAKARVREIEVGTRRW